MENHEDILLSTSASIMASSPLESTECHSTTSTTNPSAFYIPKTSSSSPVRIPHSFHVKSLTNSDRSDASNSDDENGHVHQTPSSSPQMPSEKRVIAHSSNNNLAPNSTPGVGNFSSLSNIGFPFMSPFTQPNLLLPLPLAYSYKSSSAFQTSMTDDLNFPVNFPLNPVTLSRTMNFSPLMNGFAYNHVPFQSSFTQSQTSADPSQSDRCKVFINEMEDDSTSQTLDLRVSPQSFKNEKYTINGVHASSWMDSLRGSGGKTNCSMETQPIPHHISPINIPFSAVSLFQNTTTLTKSDEASRRAVPSHSGNKWDKQNESHSSNHFIRMHLSPQVGSTLSDQYISPSNEVCASSSSSLVGSVPQKRSNEHNMTREFTQNKVVIIQTEDAIEHFKNSLRFAETKNRGKLMNDFPTRCYSTTAPSSVSPFILNSIDTHFKHSLNAYGDVSPRKNVFDEKRMKEEDKTQEDCLNTQIFTKHTKVISPSSGKSFSDLELHNVSNSDVTIDHLSMMDCSNSQDSPIIHFKTQRNVPISGCKPKRYWSVRYQQNELPKEDVDL